MAHRASAWSRRFRGRLGVEMVLALVVGVAAFVLAAVVGTAARSHVPTAPLVCFFFVVCLGVAHYGGVLYALPVGIATINALDWTFLPPLRELDTATLLLLALFLVMSVLVGGVAAQAGWRATASEEARGALADEQAALRRVATMVARQVSPAQVFALVTAEVGKLLRLDYAQMLVYESDGTGVVVAGWSSRGGPIPVGTRLALEGDNLAGRVLRTQRPARIDDYAAAEGSTAEYVRTRGVRAAVGTPIVVDGRVWGLMTAGYLRPEPLPAGTETRIEAFTELVATAIANAQARTEIARLAEEQAALRRVATIVARSVQPGDVFATVAEEIGRVLDVEVTAVVRYEADARATVLASSGEDSTWPVGSTWTLERESVLAQVLRTRRPARMDERSATVAAPIIIDDRLWGAALASSSGLLPDAAEERIANFADLIATAISNAETRTQLTTSRARVVAAADETRRRLERDLHDGIQQRLVTLALKARATATTTPEPAREIQDELSSLADGLVAALDELREFSRGIHPAVLSEAGLVPALKELARRSPVAIALDLDLDSRLEAPVEVAAYYVASEALTNAVKHAQASVIELHVDHRDGALTLAIRDDGAGGADPSRGSGIIGLVDRVEALGGRVSVVSPPGDGTTVRVRLPVDRTSAAKLGRSAPSTSRPAAAT
jgi:signal transduction histidine kinase